jgi:hypothetical protein
MKELKVIVAGGRDFNDYDRLSAVIFDYAESVGEDVGVSIVSGMAAGADGLAHQFAMAEDVQVYEFPADWNNVDVPGAVVKQNRYGKPYNAVAGHNRNRAMAEFADVLIAFHDGKSRGTANMIQTMRDMGKGVHVHSY